MRYIYIHGKTFIHIKITNLFKAIFNPPLSALYTPQVLLYLAFSALVVIFLNLQGLFPLVCIVAIAS